MTPGTSAGRPAARRSAAHASLTRSAILPSRKDKEAVRPKPYVFINTFTGSKYIPGSVAKVNVASNKPEIIEAA